MLADTCGYKYDERASAAFNRLVIMYFATLIMYRGSHTGVTFAAELNLAQFNLQKYAEENPILDDRLEDTSLPANSVSVIAHPELGYFDLVYYSEKIPTDVCLEYVRPLGMYCFSHAGVVVNARTKISIDARLTDLNQNNSGTSNVSFVAHYRRNDFARLQAYNEFGEPEPRSQVYYRNKDAEEHTDPRINPGYRSLFSLQLCNNEHIVKALIPSIGEEYDQIFSIGYDPQNVGVTFPDDYLKNPSEQDRRNPFNLRIDRGLEESFTPSVYTVESANSVIEPRPAVNPVMFSFGDAMSLNSDNTAYTKVKQDTGEIIVVRRSEDRPTIPSPTISSLSVNLVDVTVSYSLPPLGESSYALVKLAAKQNIPPRGIEDADNVIDLPANRSTAVMSGLAELTTYFFTIFVEDDRGTWAQSTPESITTEGYEVPPATINSAVASIVRVTVDYTIPQLAQGYEYDHITLAAKKGSVPSSESDADVSVSLVQTDTESILYPLDELSTYYIVIFSEDTRGHRATSASRSVTTGQYVLPAATISSTSSTVTTATANYTIPTLASDYSYTNIVVAMKEGSAPASIADADATKTITQSSTTSTFDSLDELTTYYFVIFSEDNWGHTASSTPASTTTQPYILPASTISNLSVDVVDVTVTYSVPVLVDHTYDYITLAIKKDSAPVSIADADLTETLAANQTTKLVEDLDEDSTYYFVIFSADTQGHTAQSEAQHADTESNGWNFPYSGDIQTFTAPETGVYNIEAWGAQGDADGGYGGYSTGQVILNEGETVYIGVGGQSGFNGGGSPVLQKPEVCNLEAIGNSIQCMCEPHFSTTHPCTYTLCANRSGAGTPETADAVLDIQSGTSGVLYTIYNLLPYTLYYVNIWRKASGTNIRVASDALTVTTGAPLNTWENVDDVTGLSFGTNNNAEYWTTVPEQSAQSTFPADLSPVYIPKSTFNITAGQSVFICGNMDCGVMAACSLPNENILLSFYYNQTVYWTLQCSTKSYMTNNIEVSLFAGIDTTSHKGTIFYLWHYDTGSAHKYTIHSLTEALSDPAVNGSTMYQFLTTLQ